MGNRDIKKLLSAGFRVFKLSIQHTTIYEAIMPFEWKEHQKCKSRDDALKQWNELMEHPKHISL